MSLKESIDTQNLPNHVAIIMDGNGRWAQKRGNIRIFGHKNGVKSVKDTVEGCGELGIKFLTLYAFSTENWNRPKVEVDALMTLLVSTINSEVSELNKNNVRLLTIGNTDSLPDKVQKKLIEAMEATKNNTGLSLVLALSYSARWEIVDATKKIAQQVKDGIISINDIDDTIFAKNLTTAQIPDPELLIRTSGEYRISNFLLWQIAYSELYITETLWPDFCKDDLHKAIVDYQNRERRFGKTTEQIQSEK